MVCALISEWIDEFESLTESEIHTYAAEQGNNQEVITALYSIFAEPHKYKSDNLIDSICQHLLQFYRSGEPELHKFAFQYIPSLVFLHLSDRSCTVVQTLLVSIYNLEVVDSKGQPLTYSFRIPSVAYPSIYHNPSSIDPKFIAESSLRRWEECNTKLVSWGPLPQIENINAQNRQKVVTALIFLYNRQLANVKIQGIEFCCRGISKLMTQGFHSNPDSSRSSVASDCSSTLQSLSLCRRIQVSSHLLVELLHIVYNGAGRCANGAVQALHDIIQRATYENYAEALLTGNAIKNLLQNSHSISATSRPSHVHSVSKSMITNASFRTKKLPDDIPIQNDQQQLSQQADTSLELIAEEQEETDKTKNKTTAVSALKHLPKLSGLTKKHRDRTKSSTTTITSNASSSNNTQNDQNSVEMSSMDGIESSSACTNNDTTNYNNTVHVSAV